MKFDSLASYTPNAIKRRAVKVRVVHRGTTDIHDLPGLTDIFSTSSGGPQYLTWVNIDEEDDCIVSCSCKMFLYTLETALADADASIVLYSNGEEPNIKNPMQHTYLCKHLYRVWMGKTAYGLGYHPLEEDEEDEEDEEEE